MANPNITEWKHIVRPGADECHYRNYLVSGAHLCQYVTDCVACISSAREGTGGLVANLNANFRAEVHAMDELVVTLKFESAGRTSRKYSFSIEKTIEYANDGTATAKILEAPLHVADGDLVLVCKPH